MKKIALITLAVATLALVLVGCQPVLTGEFGNSVSRTSNISFTEYALIAGQNTTVGSVFVGNDADNLYVTYEVTAEGVALNEVHLWVGTTLAKAPLNKQGVPVPGQFPYKATALNTTSYSFTISASSLGLTSFTAACGSQLYVLAHAALNIGETAWTDGVSFASWTGTKRWGSYSTYTITCPQVEEEEVIYLYETAFAKGTLTLSSIIDTPRWGWAINVTTPGVSSYEIWAAAGKNDTANGVLVGTLSVDFNGSVAVVTYNITIPYKLTELHIYAGDTQPTTVAPGQFGYTAEVTSNTYSASFNVSDSNADGIWIVAHAVVGIPQ
jgi:hypothetical protein